MVNDRATPSARPKVQLEHTKPASRDFTQKSYSDNKSINYLWLPPVQPNYIKPNFKPEYWQPDCYKAINAIIEIRTLWKYVINEAYYNYSNMYSRLSIPLSERIKLVCQKHVEAFAVYDTKTQKWLIEPGNTDYKYCYNGEFFEEFKKDKQMPIENRLLLVGKYTILKQEVNLLMKTTPCIDILNKFVIPRMNLTVGVPGCGKTTYILNKHYSGDLVLTSCAEGAQDIRSRVAQSKGGQPFHYRHSYRTIDSYLLNSREEYSDVWIDEALMEHPGKIFLVCLFSRCRRLYLLGDPNHLGYINRVKAISLRYEQSSMFFKPTETLNTSYRCPVDVMAVLSSRYDEGAYSTSTVERSMTYKKFTHLDAVPKDKDTKYLVFKQAEKKQMQKAGYDVSTIHEFQGKEAKHVILVRMSSNLNEQLYESPPHILVGVTRHRESFIYYTPVRDKVQQTIEKSQAIKELSKHKVTPVLESGDISESKESERSDFYDSLDSKKSNYSRTDTTDDFNVFLKYFYTRMGVMPWTPSSSNPERTVPAESKISEASKIPNRRITSHSAFNINKQTTYTPASSLQTCETNIRPPISFTRRSGDTNAFNQSSNYISRNHFYGETFLANDRVPPTSGSNRRCIPCCCIS